MVPISTHRGTPTIAAMDRAFDFASEKSAALEPSETGFQQDLNGDDCDRPSCAS